MYCVLKSLLEEYNKKGFSRVSSIELDSDRFDVVIRKNEVLSVHAYVQNNGNYITVRHFIKNIGTHRHIDRCFDYTLSCDIFLPECDILPKSGLTCIIDSYFDNIGDDFK